MKINLDIANLTDEQMQKIKEIEKELGTTVVAYQKEIKPAKLSKTQLEKIFQLEEELDLILIAFDI